MKAKIEFAANILVIGIAVLIGSLFLKDRFFAAAPETVSVKPGDTLPKLGGWNWAAQDRSLVLVLRSGCHFCEDSVPFYQRLVTREQAAASVPIVALFPDSADKVKEALQSEGLPVHAVADVPLERLKASGTPTLLLVNRSGTVLKTWVGVLSPREELEVIAATTPASGPFRNGGL